MKNDAPQILLLDDDFGEEDYSVRVMLEQIGETLGINVTCFTDTEKFLQYIKALKDLSIIRAILLDYNLNDLEVNGLNMFKRLEARSSALAGKVWGILGEWMETQKYLSQWIDLLNKLNDDEYMRAWMKQFAFIDDELRSLH